MGAVILWLWDDTNKVYIKAQCDENGYLKIDMSEISLNDLADVNVPAPTNQHILYWDAAASEWKAHSIGSYRIDELAAPTSDVAWNSQGITGLRAAIANGEALRYEQLVGLYLLLAGGTMTGRLIMNAPLGGDKTDLTLDAAGEITVTRLHHTVDTFEDAASDDLEVINGGVDRDIIVLCPSHIARTIVVKHGANKIQLNGQVDFTMDSSLDFIMLVKHSAYWGWCELSRSDNGV